MHEMELSAIDLNLLIGLEALLDTCSVTAAAARLHRSQPAVSRILGRLRDLLDDELLVLQGRQLKPTPRALALREPLKLALTELRDLLRAPTPFDAANDQRNFRLLCSDYAHVVLLGPVIENLGAVAPGVSLTVASLPANPLEALAEGLADLLLAPPELCPPWAEAESLLCDPWVCVRRQGTPLPASYGDYLSRHHLDVGLEHRFGQPIESALRALGGERRVRMTVSDFSGALFVVAQSDLVATVPRPVAERGAALLPVAVSTLPFRVPSPTISMIWSRRLTRDPAHSWLRSRVRSAVQSGA
jgi:DNA-binding transcriptional LysR family regulator